mgnify:CR=1 FL=1
MRVTIEAMGPLRKSLSGVDNPAKVDLQEGSTVADALRSVGLFGREQWNASIGGELVYDEDELKEGDCLLVFAPIAGGNDYLDKS